MDCKLKNIGCILLFLLSVSPAAAQDAWRARADVEVAAPGIVEALLPAELVSQAGDGGLDLSLMGPDGRARGFELYWREPVDDVQLTLTASRVALDANKGFVWEAPLPDRVLIRQLVIQPAARGYVGTVDVEGFSQGRWSRLVSDAAVFRANGALRGQIDLPAAVYEQLRLVFSSYDRHAKQALSPIAKVTAVGTPLGKDFAVQRLPLAFEQSETETETVIEAVLPGSGLWLRGLTVETETQFQGAWQLGRDLIAAGEKAFSVVQQGRMTHVDHRQTVLAIDLDRSWQGNSLVLKMDRGHHYLGSVTDMAVDVRLPRLVFAADREGRYTIETGAGRLVPVLHHPGDALRRPDVETAFAHVETNPQFRPVSLVERFQVKGAPFDPTGYTWRSALSVDTPGYYRLVPGLAAVLKTNGHPVRIVQDNRQVPYITGRVQSKTIALTATEAFDPKTNQSRWTIQLPGPCDQWQRLWLHAEGIFRRTVRWERPKPGNMGWQQWRADVWENHDSRGSALSVDLRTLPAEADRIRVVMDNDDNQPVQISKITAAYAAPTFYFLAYESGLYHLYGGNAQAAQPRYDLSLVQKELLAELAREIDMGAPELFQPPAWRSRIGEAFKDTGWGLYAVLGIVTLVLVGVIVRLFPKGAGQIGPDDAPGA